MWLGDIPVATIRTDQGGSGVGTFYIHTDHLNAPSKITRPSDNAAIWRWDHDPFGNGVPNEDPDGNGLSLAMNIRFAGQYADQETGLYYNYFRYFDPQSGRYITSDPIGLHGGINTYAYVGGNPISNYDPSGLMCIGGVGCYTTAQEHGYADKGDYSNYYKTACAGGDAYACFAEHVAANDDFWGHRANSRLSDYMKKKASDSQQCLDEDGIMEKIRKELAKRYADYLPNNPNDARWPSAKDVAQFHWDVFAEFGLPSSTFGGTPFGETPILTPVWCPNCRP